MLSWPVKGSINFIQTIMKKLFVLLGLVIGWQLAGAQQRLEVLKEDSWTIKWNKKEVLSATGENEERNQQTIKKKELCKKYTLEIKYNESDPAKQNEWKRTIMIFDENDNELLKKETRDWQITAAQLKKAVGTKKKIKIYTIALPTDPDLAARIRVRRIHLATIELK